MFRAWFSLFVVACAIPRGKTSGLYARREKTSTCRLDSWRRRRSGSHDVPELPPFLVFEASSTRRSFVNVAKKSILLLVSIFLRTFIITHRVIKTRCRKFICREMRFRHCSIQSFARDIFYMSRRRFYTSSDVTSLSLSLCVCVYSYICNLGVHNTSSSINTSTMNRQTLSPFIPLYWPTFVKVHPAFPSVLLSAVTIDLAINYRCHDRRIEQIIKSYKLPTNHHYCLIMINEQLDKQDWQNEISEMK
jgi:hypothetical protein